MHYIINQIKQQEEKNKKTVSKVTKKPIRFWKSRRERTFWKQQRLGVPNTETEIPDRGRGGIWAGREGGMT